MASGSQTWSGIWADLPIAPQKTQSRAAESVAAKMAGFATWKVLIPSAMPSKLRLPVMRQSIRMPIMKPKSPMRFTMKAFLAASAADSF